MSKNNTDNPYEGDRLLVQTEPTPDLPKEHNALVDDLALPDIDIKGILKWAQHIHTTKAYNTYDSYFYDFLNYARWIDEKDYDIQISNINSDAVTDYMQTLTEKGDHTKQNKYYAIKSFYNFVDQYEDIDCDPFDNITPSDYFDWQTEGKRNKHEPDTQARYVSPEEKELLWENVPNPKTRNRLIIDLLWQCGLRQSEIVQLSVDDVKLDKRKLTVYAPKTDDTRPNWYQPNLDYQMQKWINVHRKSYTPSEKSDYLFVSHVSGKLEPDRINKIVKQSAENAGIQEVVYEDDHDSSQTGLENVDGDTTWKRYRFTAHKLRRGYAVQFLKNGGDIKRLCDLMGHTSIEQTQDYLDLLESDKKEAQQNYGPK